MAAALPLVILGGYFAARLVNAPSGNPQQYGPQAGPQTARLVSPDHVRLQIVAVERGVAIWYFHIHAHNNTTRRMAILGDGADHYFALGGVGVAGTSYSGTQLFLRLIAPTGADLATHPALPPVVNGGGDADGWLVADFSRFPYPSDGFLYYVYGTVTAPACARPADPATCHPSTGFRTLVWRLS